MCSASSVANFWASEAVRGLPRNKEESPHMHKRAGKFSVVLFSMLQRKQLQTFHIGFTIVHIKKFLHTALTDLKSKREKKLFEGIFSVKTTVSSLNFIPRSTRRPIKFCGSLCSAQAWELTWRAQAFYADTDSLETHRSLNVESVRLVEWERFYWTEHFWIFVVGLFQSYSFQHELGIRSW